jgi:hypothetical protein
MHEALRLIGVTSQIVDHVNNTDARQKGGTATPYGSAYKTNAARISWEVRKAPSANGLAINLYHAKSNDTQLLPPIGLSLDWENDAITFQTSEVLEEEETGRGETTAERIVDVVSGGEHWELQAIAKILSDIPYDTVKKTTQRLVARSVLHKDDAGRIFEPPKPGYKLRSLPGSRGLDA